MADNLKYHQIPLGLGVDETTEMMSSFVVDPCNEVPFNFVNQTVLQDLKQTSKFIYLYGEEGSGKTHLMRATIKEIEKRGFSSIFINLADYIDMSPSYLLQGVENIDFICFDNFDVVAGNYEWESELFDLYNRWLRIQRGVFVVIASKPQDSLNVAKRDLVTRLLSGTTLHIKQLPKEVLADLLIKREALRGGILPQKRAETIVKEFNNIKDCMNVLDEFDKAVLEQKKKFTEELLKEIIATYKKSIK